MTLITLNNYVFCPPELGKPDSRYPRSLSGPDKRPRVIQKPSHGNCWFVTGNFIRNRWKASNIDESLPARKFEKLVSSVCKETPQIKKKVPFGELLHFECVESALSTVTKDQLQKVEVQNALRILCRESRQEENLLETTIQEFKSQEEYYTLYDFLFYKVKSAANFIQEKWLREVEKICNHVFKIPEGLPFNTVFDNLSFLSMQLLGLELSTWDPKQPFECLVEELKKNGPLRVLGFFGRGATHLPPRKTNWKVDNRDVYSWLPSERKHAPFAHSVLLIGAEKFPTRNIVYYIDPNDTSDPSHPEKQKIYAMSYETLTNPHYILNNECKKANDGSNKTRFHWVGHAMYKAKESTFGQLREIFFLNSFH